MLWMTAVILVIVWMLGLATGYRTDNFIHIPLFFAIIVMLIHIEDDCPGVISLRFGNAAPYREHECTLDLGLDWNHVNRGGQVVCRRGRTGWLLCAKHAEYSEKQVHVSFHGRVLCIFAPGNARA